MQVLTFDQVEAVVGGDGCTYAGQTYSEGSRVEQAGEIMVCQAGEWVYEN